MRVFLTSPWIPAEWIKAHDVETRGIWAENPFWQNGLPLSAGVLRTTDATNAAAGGADIITTGYRGIGCIEVGDFPGSESCTSRSVAAALKLLQELAVIDTFAPEYEIYDMPGDVGCIGDSMLETLQIDLSLVVTSADFQPMFAATRLVGLLARLQLPVKLFVLNNDGYSSIRTSQMRYFGMTVGCDPESGLVFPDTVGLAKVYGLPTATIDSQQDLETQLHAVLEAEGVASATPYYDADW